MNQILHTTWPKLWKLLTSHLKHVILIEAFSIGYIKNSPKDFGNCKTMQDLIDWLTTPVCSDNARSLVSFFIIFY